MDEQGFYLSELHVYLAELFIDAAILANPGDATLRALKQFI